METKSRYEVICELEEKKRSLIVERDSSGLAIQTKEKAIKQIKRQVEDAEEELEEFKESLKQRRETLTELITSVDDSLKRLGDMSASQSQKK